MEQEELIKKQLKYCTGCSKILSLDKFRKKKNGKFLAKCMDCTNKHSRDLYDSNKQEIAETRKIKRMNRTEQEKNDKAKRDHEYYLQNTESILYKTNEYKKNNKDKIKEYNNREEVKLANRVRKRIKRALKNNIKFGKIKELIGCSVAELKQHLERQFYTNSKTGEQMTWDNYGFYGWHLDHVIPLASFNLIDREQVLKACHYTNLQPLWAKDNLQKGKKINWSK